MGILSNPKHEAFAQALAKGASASDAYVSAGYKRNDGNASRLKGNEKVQARVHEIMSAAAKRTAKTLDDVIAEYERIAFSGLSKFVSIGEDGTPQIDLSRCTPADLDLLAEIQTDRHQMPGETPGDLLKVKIKPLDRLKALDKLAGYLGMNDKADRDVANSLSGLLEAFTKAKPTPIATAKAGDEQ
jgi:phage terminase small subunit